MPKMIFSTMPALKIEFPEFTMSDKAETIESKPTVKDEKSIVRNINQVFRGYGEESLSDKIFKAFKKDQSIFAVFKGRIEKPVYVRKVFVKGKGIILSVRWSYGKLKFGECTFRKEH